MHSYIQRVSSILAPYTLSSPQSKTKECVQYKCVHSQLPPPYINSTKECKEEECPPGYEKADEVMVDVGYDKRCPV